MARRAREIPPGRGPFDRLKAPPKSAAGDEENKAVTIRVGINGFGRIGRTFWRAVHAAPGSEIEIVAANDLTDPATNAYLLKYDTVLGKLDVDVTADGDLIRAGDQEIRILAERDPAALPWGDLGVDVVIESTGRVTSPPAPATPPSQAHRGRRGKRHGMGRGARWSGGRAPDRGVQWPRGFGGPEATGGNEPAAEGPLKPYLCYSTEPIVSSDIVGTTWSCIFDSPLTMANGDQVKVVGWYDNEFGYSNRLADLAVLAGSGRPARP